MEFLFWYNERASCAKVSLNSVVGSKLWRSERTSWQVFREIKFRGLNGVTRVKLIAQVPSRYLGAREIDKPLNSYSILREPAVFPSITFILFYNWKCSSKATKYFLSSIILQIDYGFSFYVSFPFLQFWTQQTRRNAYELVWNIWGIRSYACSFINKFTWDKIQLQEGSTYNTLLSAI